MKIIAINVLLIFSFFLTQNANSQSIVSLGNKKIVVANDLLFYDDGGATNPIGNTPFLSTIKAQSGTIKMFFTYIDIPVDATLKIYKGLDTTELIGLFDGQHKPENMYGEAFTIVYFPGNSGGISRGWEGIIEPKLAGNTQKLTMPESDCVGAIPLCSNSTVNTAANQYENTGVVNDDNGSCYSGTGSGGSVWYSFTPATNGNIDFMISPLGSTDYDYVLWNITNGCANKSQISCNFSATTGPTGLNGSGSTNSQDASGTTNNQLEAVNTTQTYAICINYYGGTNGGFNLNFQNVAGTVAVTDVTPPTIVNAYSTNCASSSTYTVNFSEYMDCNTLQASDFSIPGYTVSLTTTNCVNGRTDHVVISVSPAMPAGNYTMTVNSMNDMCGNPLNSTYNINTTTTPTANAGPDAIACSSPGIFGTTNYGSVTLNGSGGTMYDWSSGQTTASITVAPTTTTTYTLTAIQGSCASTDQVVVTVSPAPVPNLGPDQTVCATFPITLTASGGVSYQWQSTTTTFFGTPSGWANIAGATSASYTGTPATTIYYQVIVTNAAGCQGKDYIKVTIGSGVFGITAPPFVCSGAAATLSLPASMTAYTWSVGGTPIGTANTSLTVTPASTTTYTATSTTAGCTGTANVTVAVHGPLAITTAANPTNACVGIPVNLTSTGPTDTSSTSTENFEGATQGYTLVNGTYNKWYWGTAAFATGAKGLYIGTAAANNNYEIGSAFSPRSGINFAYKDYAITSYCNANYNFKWKCNGQAAQAELTVWLVPTSYTPIAGTAIAASATNILLGGPYIGQTTYQNVSIPVSSYAVQNVRIVFQWSSTGAALFGGPTVANPAASIDDIVFSETSTYSYSWTSTPAGFLASTMNATATPIAATTYNLTVTRCDGCPTTSSVNVVSCISVPDTIVPIFVAVPPICSGAALANLPTTSTNGITGTWSPAINNTATTTYTFTPTAGQGATSTTMSITVTPNVTPTFAAVAPICSGTALAALPTTSTNGITGTWSPALDNTATTLYTFTPTAGLCATTTTLSITVNTPTTPTFVAVVPICSGAALAALPTTSTNGITGTWSPALNNTATTLYTFTPTTGLCATTTTLSITVNTPTTPTFAAVAPICSGAALAALPTTSTNGITGTWSPAINNTATTLYTFTPTAGFCATTTTLSIPVNPNVTPTFAAVAPICSGAALAALPTTSTNGITGTWSPALNNTATTLYTFTPTAGQCATTTTLSITVNTPTTPTFAAVAPICSGAALAALPTTSTNGITGTWSPALDNSTTTIYTFTPTAGQCAVTTTLTISVGPPAIPTFAAVAPICSGAALSALPTTSTNAITGTWSPVINNTATTLYTFTPTTGLCATTTTLSITVNTPTTPTFAAVAPICSGAALAALPTTSTNGITGTWSPALDNTATTLYTFTPTAGLCATTTTLSITVNTPTTPTFAAVPAICTGSALAALPTTSTNGITGTWSPALDNTTTTLYTFTPTAGQCATTATLTITVNSTTVTPTFTAVTPICNGAVLGALPSTSTNGITGTWSPAMDNTTTTTYTFNPTAGQCATTTTLTVTVNTITTPTFAAIAPVCSGAALAALPTTSTNGITGTWSPALDNTATTLYTFTPTAGLCATTTTLTITVNTPNTPTFAAVSAVCSGVSLAALPTTSTNGITGTWSPALDNTTTTLYTFTPTTGQCATTTTLTIIVNTPTTPTFAAVAPICSGAAVAALPTTSTNGITGTWSPALDNTTTTLYTFTPTAGLCATTTTLSITVNTPTTPTFAAVPAICTGSALAALPTTSTNGVTGSWSPALNNTTTTLYTFTPTAGQCASTTTLTITVNSTTVTPTFAVVAPICSGATLAALPTTSTNGISGTWSPAINNTTTTTYTFTPIVGQCATTTTMSITVNTPTTPTFAAVAPICTGSALSALPTTSINGITGTWSPAINNTATTLYTFTPTAGLCATTTSVTITVNPNLTPTFTALGPICSGSTLSALPTTSTNGITGIWSPAINNTATTTYTFTPTAGQCATTTTMTITVTSCILPTANFSVSDSVICAGSCITFTNHSTATTSWQWTFQNGTPSSSTSQNPGTICFNSAGIQQIKLVVSNTFGKDSSIHFINVVQPQLVFVSNDTTIQLGQSVNLNATGVSNGVYTWTPPFDLTCNVCPNPTATPGETITYTVISTDSNGCSSSDNISIIVQFENVIFVPNIFSPNGDGVNDMLFVRGMGVSKLKFFLYDRWGEKVFETTSLELGWDGTFRGEDMNKAVFVYYLEATFSDGKEVTQKGDITLVK